MKNMNFKLVGEIYEISYQEVDLFPFDYENFSSYYFTESPIHKVRFAYDDSNRKSYGEFWQEIYDFLHLEWVQPLFVSDERYYVEEDIEVFNISNIQKMQLKKIEEIYHCLNLKGEKHIITKQSNNHEEFQQHFKEITSENYVYQRIIEFFYGVKEG